MNQIRKFTILISLIALVILGYYIVTKRTYTPIEQNEVKIGGDFTLKNQDGEEVTNKNLLGKYTIVLFGFSRCPHVCPNQLAMLDRALNENDNLQAFFISVDPENDSIERLREFKKDFNPKIQMLAGDQKMIDQLIQDYKIYVQKSDNPEEFNHSTIMYLMGLDGKYKTHFTPADEEELATDVAARISGK